MSSEAPAPADLSAVDAVVLAGGVGARLRPYTFSIPKPLVRVGDQPVIEILLRQLEAVGVRRVHIALGHLAEVMQAYLEQSRRESHLQLVYSVEDQPLGTAGPLALIRDLSDTFLLVNGDLLTTVSYSHLVDHHLKQGCSATVAVRRRPFQMSYGIVEVSPDQRITRHREKPEIEVDVAMGIYVLEKRVVERIPAGQRFDVPDLLQALLASGEPIAAYTSDDYWLDVGCPEDYEAAQRDHAANPSRFSASSADGKAE